VVEVAAAWVEAEVFEDALLLELHATRHEKETASKNVLNKQGSGQEEVGIGSLLLAGVRAVNRTDVLKYVRKAYNFHLRRPITHDT
jgi:hypothetical protein